MIRPVAPSIGRRCSYSLIFVAAAGRAPLSPSRTAGSVAGFHSSVVVRKKFYDVVIPVKEAAKPITFPASVRMQIHRIPVAALPQQCPHGRFSYEEYVRHRTGLRKFRESSVYYKQMAQDTALVEIRGPLGVGYVPVPEWLDFSVSKDGGGGHRQTGTTGTTTSTTTGTDIWHGLGARGGQEDNDMTTVFSTDQVPVDQEHDERNLHIQCTDPDSPLQTRHWGFYRRRIATYVKTTTEGATLPVRLEGVGFRAQLDPLQVSGPEGKHDALQFESWLNRWKHLIEKDPLRRHIAHRFPDSFWAQMLHLRQHLNHDVSLYFRQIESPSSMSTSTSTSSSSSTSPPSSSTPTLAPPKMDLPVKLVAKLGRSHNEEILVPPFIQVTVPNPNRILLSSIHLPKLIELAGTLRKLRPPEPYKGKGVFVGDETITLKQKKIK